MQSFSRRICLSVFFYWEKRLNEIRCINNVASLLNNQKDIKVMKVLNVAEKNDAAKNIANIISRGGNRWVS